MILMRRVGMSKFKVGNKVLVTDGNGKKLVSIISAISDEWHLIGGDYFLENEIKLVSSSTPLGWL